MVPYVTTYTWSHTLHHLYFIPNHKFHPHLRGRDCTGMVRTTYSLSSLSSYLPHKDCRNYPQGSFQNRKRQKLLNESMDKQMWHTYGVEYYSALKRKEILTVATMLLLLCPCPSHVWLFNCMDCNLPGSSDRGILQARILEWVAISFSRRSSWLRDWTHICCIFCTAGEFFTAKSPEKSIYWNIGWILKTLC